MTILVGGGLQVADGREIAGSQSSEEIAEIVLMIRLIRLPDRSDWRQVMLVVRAGIILERLVVRNVIGHGSARNVGMRCRANGRTPCHRRRSEAALEPSPGNSL